MEFYSDKEKQILELYKQIGLGSSDICKRCNAQCDLSVPIGCWCIGKHLYDNDIRILFVGKNARGNPGEFNGSYSNTFEITREVLWNKSWAYWSYTGAITEALFGADSPEYIAFTNIVKCNDSPDVDTTSEIVKNNCIKQMGIIRKEIELINPTHIIFYTSWGYDSYIDGIFDEYRIINDTQKKIGQKTMPWLEAQAVINDNLINVLRIGHPERKKKDDFVKNVVEWIFNNSDL